jgi:predicted amidohydrolase
MLRVAMIQLDLGEYPARPYPIEPVAAAVRAAVADGAELVILPELWRTGPFELEGTLGMAEPAEGPTANAMSALAADTGVWLHAGTILTRSASPTPGHATTHNTAYLFDPAGNLTATYQKRHLFGFDTGEAALINSGDDVVVVDTPLGPTGLATCYDLRFPEHFRTLIDAGAESILLSSGWPARRIGHWDVLACARAIENQVNLIACNATGRSGDVDLGGHSVIYDPWGRVLAQAGGAAEVVICDVDPGAPTETRAEFPVLRDRR